jgi:hypothetical protein
MNSTVVRVGGLVFDGREDGDKGFFIEPDGLSGWFNRPNMVRASAKRQQAAGSHPFPGYSDERLITIEGKCYTRSPEEQQSYADKLAGLLEDGEFGRLTVEHQGQSLWANVGLVSQEFDIDVYGTDASYQVQLLAPDPYKYGTVRRFPADGSVGPLQEIEVFHRGNARAYPRFVVAGTIDQDYAVYGPGTGNSRKRYKVNGAVSPRNSNVIDLSDGTVILNGAIRRGVVEDATTWGIPGKTKVSHTLDSNGDPATLVVFVTDTFI